MKRVFVWILAVAAACGGGGGGGPVQLAFALSGTTPAPGSVTMGVDATIAITFTLPADLATVTTQTVHLFDNDDTPIGFDILTQDFNPTTVQLRPFFDLEHNARYRLVLSGNIQSQAGAFLGRDIQICFITSNPLPTIRPDEVVDLGDQLVEPHFLGRHVRLQDGRVLVIGGFSDPDTASDAIEVWDPATRTFELLPVRLATPRGEHTVTLLNDGRVLIAGGVSRAGGEPLDSTEIFDGRNNGLVPGPPLNVARRWHGASLFQGGTSVVVSGGFGPADEELDSVEVLDGAAWEIHSGRLPVPTVQHLQVLHGFDTVYVTSGNLRGTAAQITSTIVKDRPELDTRFRPAAARVDGNRLFVVGGDTRSINIHDFDANQSWLATPLLRTRRGAHTLTARGTTGRRFLAAGGFQITAGGRSLSTMEVVDYFLRPPASVPDAAVYPVDNVELPVPFAGHVGFIDASGVTVLAGGWGDGVGPHSRRVVLILEGGDTVECD